MALIVSDEDGPPPEGYEDIFRPSFWHWGLMRRLWAWEYGLRAFKLRVRKGGPRRIPPDRLKTKRGRLTAKRGKAPKRPTMLDATPGERFTAEQIASAVGSKVDTIRSTLARLADHKRIVKVERGLYKSVRAPEAAPALDAKEGAM